MKEAEIYIYSAINSIKAINGYGGFICACRKKDGTEGTLPYYCHLKDATKLTSNIMLLTQALSKFREPCSIKVYIQDPQSILTLKVWMPGWKNAGWRNSKGEEVSEWYRTLDRFMTGHELSFTAEKGSYSSWLETNTERYHKEERKACLISLENLTAAKS